MSDFLRSLVDDIKDEDTSILADGASSGEFSGYVDSGCYMLNAALSGSLYGGIPDNKVTAFAGESATGKTFFVLSAVREFLNSDPEAVVVYYDTEAAVTREMMESRGIDANRVIVAEPQTIQQFKTHALKMLEAYEERKKKQAAPKMMVVLDSLGLMSTNKELEDSTSGKDVRDMTKAQVIKATFRVLTLKLAKVGVPMLVTNHVYEVVGSYVPTKEMGGGTGLKYAASSIVFLGKKKEKDKTNKQVGNIIKVRMQKSRFTKENSQVELLLNFKTGLHKWYGLLEFAIKQGIVEQAGAWYTFPDGQRAKGGDAVYNEPEKFFTEEVMAVIEDAIQTEFKYG